MTTLITKSDFLLHFPAIKNLITSYFATKGHLQCPEVAINWLEKLLDYNVPTGKLNRGLTIVHAYQCLNDDISNEDLNNICKLGWTVELLESCFLVADDVMDCSITRRGRPCWYKNEDIGLTAVNDSYLFENSADLIMYEILKTNPSYLNVLEIFREAKLMTILGQHLDSERFNIELCTKERYCDITRCKTSYYTFVLPVFVGLRMSPQFGNVYDDELRELCIRMGHYFQCQDDYLDCYGDSDVTGKIGTDIEDGKCTWLLVEALQVLGQDQRKIIEDNYARKDQICVKFIKNLYNSIDLKSKYNEFERKENETLSSMIEKLPLVRLKFLFRHLLNLLRGRDK